MKYFFLLVAFFSTSLFYQSAVAQAEKNVSKLSEVQLLLDSEITQNEKFNFNEKDNYFKDTNSSILKIIEFEFSKKDAEKFIENQLVQLQLLFAPQKAAYAGMISKDQICKNMPEIPKKINRNKVGSYFYAEVSATAEGQYGSCGLRDEPYLSQRLVIYCKKSGKLYDIHYLRLIKSGAKYLKRPIAKCN
jgi:hypothetical protein